MREVKLYDSQSRSLKSLKVEDNTVWMYVCGPTVYNYTHIGNARPIIVFDNLRRLLEKVGYQVNFISNYTDVDDKIIQAALKEKLTEKEITEKYIAYYESLRRDLNAALPTFTPKVTNYMDQIIAFIDVLVKKGYAYEIDGDIYFRVNKIDGYGKISNKNVDDLLVGARIEENIKKENSLDFTLWKKTDIGIKWQSPWSLGRPGWHTECVAMINDLTPHTKVHIHGGGMDLKFPHHENEQAQALAYCNHDLADIWMHNGMLNINNEKMSKSLNNYILAKDLIDNYGGQLVRWVMNSTHYRAPINFTDEIFITAKQELTKIYTSLKQANIKIQLEDYEASDEVEETLFAQFLNALCDDLNIPLAVTYLYETVKQLNQNLRQREIDLKMISMLLATANGMLDLMGMLPSNIVLTSTDIEIYNKWQYFKSQKDFENADKLRNELINRGIL